MGQHHSRDHLPVDAFPFSAVPEWHRPERPLFDDEQSKFAKRVGISDIGAAVLMESRAALAVLNLARLPEPGRPLVADPVGIVRTPALQQWNRPAGRADHILHAP